MICGLMFDAKRRNTERLTRGVRLYVLQLKRPKAKRKRPPTNIPVPSLHVWSSRHRGRLLLGVRLPFHHWYDPAARWGKRLRTLIYQTPF